VCFYFVTSATPGGRVEQTSHHVRQNHHAQYRFKAARPEKAQYNIDWNSNILFNNQSFVTYNRIMFCFAPQNSQQRTKLSGLSNSPHFCEVRDNVLTLPCINAFLLLMTANLVGKHLRKVLKPTRPPLWSSGQEFLATDPEVPGSIPDSWNGVRSAS
jgi:hypothetical protein